MHAPPPQQYPNSQVAPPPTAAQPPQFNQQAYASPPPPLQQQQYQPQPQQGFTNPMMAPPQGAPAAFNSPPQGAAFQQPPPNIQPSAFQRPPSAQMPLPTQPPSLQQPPNVAPAALRPPSQPSMNMPPPMHQQVPTQQLTQQMSNLSFNSPPPLQQPQPGQYQGPPPPQQMMHPNQPPQMNMMASPPPMPQQQQQQQQQQFPGGPLAAPPQHPSHPPSMPPMAPTHIQGPPMGNSLPPQQNMMMGPPGTMLPPGGQQPGLGGMPPLGAQQYRPNGSVPQMMGGPQQYPTAYHQPPGGAPMPPGPGPQQYQQQQQPGAPQYQDQQGGGQQQQRMDMDQIPNPIEVAQANTAKYGGGGELFETNEAGKIPPLVTTDFVCKDGGNCNPRFMRSSIYAVPTNPDLLKQSKLPLVLSLTPFAQLRPDEMEPPLSDTGELGPVRCKRCKAYMCPFMQFIENGKRFQCPFCEDVTTVPEQYFSHLDHMGRRLDHYERAELSLGSYEFTATKDYCRQQQLPQTPALIFAIDVTLSSVRSGLLHVLCPYLKETVLPRLAPDTRVGFVTYDRELHFYNCRGNLAAPQMMVVSDLGGPDAGDNEVFVPMVDGFLVKLSEAKAVVDLLLDTLPSLFTETKETELVFAPVVEAAVEALKSSNLCGKLFMFHTGLPNSLTCAGHLKMRDDKKLLGTDKEKTLLSPVSDYYGGLGKRCVETGLSVDLFLLPNQYSDVATLGELCRKTAGQIYKYDFFMADAHGQRLCDDLGYAVENTVAFDGVMKVRTSTGIRAVDYLGNFSQYGNDIELAGMQRSQTLSVELKHDDKLNENSKVYIQAALLYTTLSGQRRIRIHNLSLSVCTAYAAMFSSCEHDTLINYMAKLAARSCLVSTPKSIRENLIQQICTILAVYRKNCTNSPARGQFILPETLKLLPIFSNSLLKSDAIAGAQNITTDDRSWLMYRLMSMDVASTYAYFYPRVIPVHDLTAPSPIPPATRCIYERLREDGIYILENGLVMYLWIGANADPNHIQNLFGVAGSQLINVEKCKILEIDTPISINLRSVIQLINDQRKTHLKLIVVRQRDNLEIFFKNQLVEDKGISQTSMSYVEYLYHLHREIKNILS